MIEILLSISCAFSSMLQPVTQKQHAVGLQFYEVHSLMEVVSWIKTVDRIGYPDKKLPQDIHNKQHTACTACIILCNIKHPVCTGAGRPVPCDLGPL